MKEIVIFGNRDLAEMAYFYFTQTGKKVSFASKKTLIESFKSEKIDQNFDVNLKNNNRFNNNNILKFY